MKKKRRKYTQEFKEETVKLIADQVMLRVQKSNEHHGHLLTRLFDLDKR